MKFEMYYKKVRNLLFVLWFVRNVDFVIKKIPFVKLWLEELETSAAGEYVSDFFAPLLENPTFQDTWDKIYSFFGSPAFMLLISMIVVKFLFGKIREADLILFLRKIFASVNLTIERSSVPRIRIGKSRYIRVMNEGSNADDIIAIEAERETQYEDVTFYKKKGKVYLQKPDGQKMYLEKDIWKKLRVEDEELWVKLV